MFVEAHLAQREPAVTEWIGTWPPEEGTGLVLVWAAEPRGLREVVLPRRARTATPGQTLVAHGSAPWVSLAPGAILRPAPGDTNTSGNYTLTDRMVDFDV